MRIERTYMGPDFVSSIVVFDSCGDIVKVSLHKCGHVFSIATIRDYNSIEVHKICGISLIRFVTETMEIPYIVQQLRNQ